MIQIITYSLLLCAGLFVSQSIDLSPIDTYLDFVTLTFLCYIMIEVGLEFTLDKKNLKKYGKDYLVASGAAGIPWILAAGYFYYVLGGDLKESLVIGRFAAPTSAGILFAMLGAAGLGTTWLFHRARVLAIFDDLDTILFMIPLKFLFAAGFAIRLGFGAVILLACLYLAFRYLHQLKWPISGKWMVLYSVLLVLGFEILEHTTYVVLEVLLPAFCLGCVLYNPHDPSHPEKHRREHEYFEHQKESWRYLDITIKNSFMFLVGCSIPQINIESLGANDILYHVVLLTILSNVGKLFPLLFYKKEASFRERLALSIAMFPRGEVGAAVLFIAIDFGLNETLIGIGVLSLTLNLLMTGLFVAIVIWLIKPIYKGKLHAK